MNNYTAKKDLFGYAKVTYNRFTFFYISQKSYFFSRFTIASSQFYYNKVCKKENNDTSDNLRKKKKKQLKIIKIAIFAFNLMS